LFNLNDHHEWRNLIRVVVFLVIHTVILIVVLLGVVTVESIMHLLHAGERNLFDKVPVSYVFDASEVALIVAFAFASARQAWRRFNDEGEGGGDLGGGK